MFDDDLEFKYCGSCNQYKFIDEFAYNNRGTGTRQYSCKRCAVQYNKDNSYGRFKTSKVKIKRQLKRQKNRCGLCKRKLVKFTVDHDHVTGRHRMILCYKCNTGLGMLCDDPELLRRAADYVEFYRRANATAKAW